MENGPAVPDVIIETRPDSRADGEDAQLRAAVETLLREIDELSLHSATSRVAAYLVQNASDQSDAFNLPVAKQTVASRLSVTPETFSRIIKNLSNDGVIQVVGSRVTICDRPALNQVAETRSTQTDAF